jgi:hypothetical protein
VHLPSDIAIVVRDMSRIVLILALCSTLAAARPMEVQTSLHSETSTLSTDFALVGWVTSSFIAGSLFSSSQFLFFTYPFSCSSTHVQASPLQAFEQWIARYNKDYVDDTLEKTKRLGIFKSNAAAIAQHNANPASTFIMAINEFADLTFEEFASTRLGLNMSLGGSLRDRAVSNEKPAAASFRYANMDAKDIPSAIDWRKKGAVTPVKNQGMCGSCKFL